MARRVPLQPKPKMVGLQASREAWRELFRTLGTDRVAQLLGTPAVLKAELVAAEARLQRSNAA